MENKKSTIKLYSFTYGTGINATILVLAAIFCCFGIFLLPEYEGSALLICSLLFILYSFCLFHLQYLNYITLTNKTISTKKKSFSWNEVCITMTLGSIHKSIRRTDFYFYFDDHYLSDEEICSRKVRKDAFYLMVNLKRLDTILQWYTQPIVMLDICRTYKNKLYDKVCAHNNSLATGESSN